LDAITLEGTTRGGEQATQEPSRGGGKALQAVYMASIACPIDVRRDVAIELFNATVRTMNWERSCHRRNRNGVGGVLIVGR
jgi:hypothetical protein